MHALPAYRAAKPCGARISALSSGIAESGCFPVAVHFLCNVWVGEMAGGYYAPIPAPPAAIVAESIPAA